MGQLIHHNSPLFILTLSAPCAGSACTSVQTEIIYENLQPSMWRVSVNFIKIDEWRRTLQNLLDDITAVSGESGKISRDDLRPALDAWEVLKEVYPHLRALPFPPPHQDVHTLLEHEPVVSMLGTNFQMTGTGFDSLELQLRPYLTSYTTEEQLLEPFVWHLVDSVRIYGAFEVLASGAITLVDVPGFGDANKTRTRRTKEYLKNVEVVILVADIKRAADDQAMHDYFEKFLHQMIAIDGRVESLLILLTGADVRINEDQLHHLGSGQRQIIQKMRQDIFHLSESLDEQEKQYDILFVNYLAAPTGSAECKELLERVRSRKSLKEHTTSQLQQAKAAKDTYIAHQRSARARKVFLELYRQVYFTIKQDSACQPPSLPIFCIGSTDYTELLLTERRHRPPVVFTDLEDTGIPQLCRHIHDFGSRKAIWTSMPTQTGLIYCGNQLRATFFLHDGIRGSQPMRMQQEDWWKPSKIPWTKY